MPKLTENLVPLWRLRIWGTHTSLSPHCQWSTHWIPDVELIHPAREKICGTYRMLVGCDARFYGRRLTKHPHIRVRASVLMRRPHTHVSTAQAHTSARTLIPSLTRGSKIPLHVCLSLKRTHGRAYVCLSRFTQHVGEVRRGGQLACVVSPET